MDRLWRILHWAVGVVAPQVVLAQRCKHCGTRLKLAHEEIAEYQGGYIVRHTWFWSCATCEDRSAETRIYFRDLDVWEHC